MPDVRSPKFQLTLQYRPLANNPQIRLQRLPRMEDCFALNMAKAQYASSCWSRAIVLLRGRITLAGMLRHRLHFGPYSTPKVRIGQRVEDERRGTVRVAAINDGKIQWPIGSGPGGLSLVLYGGLARAVRREGAAAVMHWWGVGQATVWKWRQVLGVPRWNEGDLRLKMANGKRNQVVKLRCTPRPATRCVGRRLPRPNWGSHSRPPWVGLTGPRFADGKRKSAANDRYACRELSGGWRRQFSKDAPPRMVASVGQSRTASPAASVAAFATLRQQASPEVRHYPPGMRPLAGWGREHGDDRDRRAQFDECHVLLWG